MRQKLSQERDPKHTLVPAHPSGHAWVPTSASAAWHVTQGVEEVWRGELTDVQYILQADL